MGITPTLRLISIMAPVAEWLRAVVNQCCCFFRFYGNAQAAVVYTLYIICIHHITMLCAFYTSLGLGRITMSCLLC